MRDRLARLARVFAPLFRAWGRRSRFARRLTIAGASLLVVVGTSWGWLEYRRAPERADPERALRATRAEPVEQDAVLGDGALDFDLGIEEGRAVQIRVTRTDANGQLLHGESVTKRVRTSRFSFEGLPAGDLHVAAFVEGDGRTTWRETTVEGLGASERRAVVFPDVLHPGTIHVRLEFVDENGAPLADEHLIDVQGRYGLEPTTANRRMFGAHSRVTVTRIADDGIDVRLEARSEPSALVHTFDGLSPGRYVLHAHGPALRDGLDWARAEAASAWVTITEEEPKFRLRRATRSS